MDYKRKLKNDVNNVHQEFIKAVSLNKIDEWLDDCVDFYLIYNRNHVYVSAEIVVTLNGPTITLYTRTGQLVGTWFDEQYIDYIGDDYISALDEFIEDNYSI